MMMQDKHKIPITILICDDDEDDRMLTQQALEEAHVSNAIPNGARVGIVLPRTPAVGVPPIMPALLIVIPAGNAPAEIVKVLYGAVPPEPVNIWL